MTLDAIFFIIFSTVAIASGLIMITRKHPLAAALSLVITFISLSGLYSLLSAKLLFIIQILVYAGAIMTLVIFSIMLLNVQDDDLPKEEKLVSRSTLALTILSPIVILLVKILNTMPESAFPTVDDDYGSINQVGLFLFNNYTFPFEVISILLLISLLGVVVLAKRRI